MPSVASNLGNKSYPDDPAAVTNKGAVYQDSFSCRRIGCPSGGKQRGSAKGRSAVSVYKKGKGGTTRIRKRIVILRSVRRKESSDEKRFGSKRDNRGASLLAVLVLMVVVSAIAVVITKITIVNIEMKEVERGTKKNFYSADAAYG